MRGIYFISFSPSYSDYTLKVKVRSKPRTREKSEYGFYFAYASAEISFMSSKDQKELYSKSIKQVKGGQMDLNLAGMKSLDNLLKKLKDELPIMIANF